MARTAVVAGTATAVSGGMQRRAAAKADQQAADQAPPVEAEAPPPYQPPEPAAPEGMTEDRLDQLKKLGELKAAGVLTEAEFAAEKAKILQG